MITSFSLHTDEIDDVDEAVGQILTQFKGAALRKHAVGLVSCFADFIGSGVLEAVAKALPFPLAGITTIYSAANGVQGETQFIVNVLTSDDVEFVVGVTPPISSEDIGPLKAGWDKYARKGEKPSLMLSFAPLLMNVAADFFAESWSGIAGEDVPNFGTLAVDHNADYHEAQTIMNGESWSDRYVFVLLYGEVSPRFFIGGLPEEKAFNEKGVVTSSQSSILKGVNGVSVAEYLGSIGLEKDENGVIKGVNSYPFILDFNDGTQPIIRVMFALTPDGSAVCGGRIPEGSTLTVGTLSAESVLAATAAVLKEAKGAAVSSGGSLLIFSCIGRYFAQGYGIDGEVNLAEDILGDTPYFLCYSGTELSPVYGKSRGLTNRSHNDTMVVCVL